MNQVQEHFHIASVLDRISDSVFSLNSDRLVTYVNRQAINLFNIREEHIVGKSFEQIINNPNLVVFIEKLNQAFQTKINSHFEILWPVKELKWLEVNVYAASDGVTVLLKDITTRKQVEEKINEKQEKLLLLCEAANHLIYEKEPKKLLDALFKDLSEYLDLDVYFNYIFDKQLNKLRLLNFAGIPESIAKEIEWLDFGEAVCGCVARDMKRIIEENIDLSDESNVQLVKGFGIKAYACHPLIAYGKLIGTLSFGSSKRSSFTDEEIELIRTVCNQVAMTLDRMFIIAELTQKKEDAEKANQAKTNFISMMSHELRTPLNSIIGFSQILMDDAKEPLTLKQTDKMSKVLKASRHLLSLINDILDFTRLDYNKETLKFEPIKVSTLINNCLKIIQPLADKKQITINNFTLPYSDRFVLANSTKLTQVFLNLLGNAIKYTHQEGNVTLTCQTINNQLKILVSDTGIGIAPEEQEKIFYPFYRIFDKDLNIEGVGLGLSIVKQLLQAMGGNVGVNSSLGEGSTFWFTIPLL